MRANLHLHSRYSDGTSWPDAIAAALAARGIEEAALTDHDNLSGAAEFAAACSARGIMTLPACEIDVSVPEIGYRSELLAYFPGGSCAATERLLAPILASRRERIGALAAAAAAFFGRPELTIERIVERKLEGRSPRPDAGLFTFTMVDLYSFLHAEGAVDGSGGYKAFLKAFIDAGKLVGPKLAKPGVAAIVAAVRADAGLVVLPHPGHQFDDDPARMAGEEGRLVRLLGFFRDSGVAGVELYWYGDGARSEAMNALVARNAEELGLFVTYGSDCHGPGSGKYTVDSFWGEFSGFPRPAEA
jgi:3',5'-nucleoside bisphosphate phosphatase